ncbi:MAG: glycosyltransferase family 4 protein [Anaerolineae bacterium]|jgi:glycosyltransferase involved in cell wall biosynthesis|nr:glycosyltransferase family 4 protein [Anaerolineae bacterium]MBT3714261.1 glycosyltransferase family 4 protein [Anaerolineae bacterium]MBT4310597.1 glycosyltransferase family 4 protein [Anaerolineae bacterium]MBT4459000.1 glycosyltransferase family 4 protein [Anaerolineae bacterium]MBT4842610.1 glycosyltransferase family 4 protein [Anaerolineae bacterium]
MKILFVADGRSPIALNWIKYWTTREYEVFLASTFPVSPNLTLAHVDFIPAAFSQAKSTPSAGSRQKKKSPLWGAATMNLRTAIRHWLGPLTLPKAALKLNELIAEIQPDIVHAMRVPYEGMLASTAKKLAGKNFPPLLISIWGNDFTLHAPASPLMRKYTRQTLQLADALHADCHRDIKLAEKWGFNTALPSIVLPGAGGIDRNLFYPPTPNEDPKGFNRNIVKPESKPSTSPHKKGNTIKPFGARELLVINPRGFRSYIRNDIFFKAIPLVLAERPEVKFICPTMAGEVQAEAWIREFNVEKSVELTPPLKREQLANTFRRAQVLVSPSTHDGTPNSLLEGIACGCFPIAGDLESIREWITPEVNGLLIDPADEKALANAILRALNDDDLREQAIVENQKIITERADYNHSMAQAEQFYKNLRGL